MDKISLILTGILMLAMVVIMAPNVLALNRGKVLRNIAIWLAIAVVLGLVYRNFGPGRNQTVSPFLAQHENQNQAPPAVNAGQAAGDQGFTPPGD